MADRIGVISKGRLLVVEEKAALIKKLGRKQLTVHLQDPLEALPEALADQPVTLAEGGEALVYTYDIQREETGIPEFLRQLDELGLAFRDLHTEASSLEEIFVSLVAEADAPAGEEAAA